MSDIKHERGVTLAHMLSCQFPIYPDCGRMEYCLKFDPYRRVLPFTRGVEDSPIPGDTTIVDKSGINLPSVRHAHLVPASGGLIGSVPMLLLANISRIRTRPPLVAQTHGLGRGQVRCFFACRESRRAYGACSQDSGLRQKFSTRMHGKVPFPIVMTCQLTRYPEGVSNRISCRRSVAAACSAGVRFICGLSICLPPDRPLKFAREFMELIRANITALQLSPAPSLVHAASQKRCYLVLVA